jgi:hypothetical protein
MIATLISAGRDRIGGEFSNVFRIPKPFAYCPISFASAFVGAKGTFRVMIVPSPGDDQIWHTPFSCFFAISL